MNIPVWFGLIVNFFFFVLSFCLSFFSLLLMLLIVDKIQTNYAPSHSVHHPSSTVHSLPISVENICFAEHEHEHVVYVVIDVRASNSPNRTGNMLQI